MLYFFLAWQSQILRHLHAQWWINTTTGTSLWARWCLKSPASRLFVQAFVQSQIKKPKLRVTGLCEGNPPMTGWFIMSSHPHGTAIGLLTHWPLGVMAVFLLSVFFFQNHYTELYLECSLWNCSQTNTTGPHWWLVNIGLGNGLVPSGNKPLSETMSTHIYVARCHRWAIMSFKSQAVRRRFAKKRRTPNLFMGKGNCVI